MQTSPQASHRIALVVLMASLLLALASVTVTAQEKGAADQAETLSQAEAATAARDWKTAASLWQRVVDANPVNGRFWNQLGNAHYEAKDYRKAITAYEKALELREGFPSNVAYNIACCYALLGDKENAIKWLEKSFALGFRNLAHAQTDGDLESLRQDARFIKLVGLVDVSKMSRDEGWRYDLNLLDREVTRKGYADGVARKISREQFHSAVQALSDRVSKLNDAQMVVEIMKLMRSVGDGHTGLLAPPQRPEFARALPIQFFLFKEGLFVIGSDPKHQDLLGAQVISLGGNSVEQLMGSLDQVINRDNDFWPNQIAPYLMRNLQLLHALGLVPEIRKAELRIRDATGRERTVTIDSDTNHPNIWNDFPEDWVTYAQKLTAPLPLYLKNTRANYWFEYLPGTKTVYFQYNRVRNNQQESLASFTERLFKFIDENDVEKLVIDMRWNNGGNTFLSQPLLHALIANKKINQRGKLFVIIGRRTFSAAQNTATFLERHTRATFVGEPTGSSPNFIGEETPFTLPYSKILVNVSDLYWQSSWPMDYRTWIAPQIYAPPKFALYRVNRDPALEAILGNKQP